MPGTRKLGRPTAHRNLMLRGMVTYLLQNGTIETTYTRAKEVSALADKMITIAKQNNMAAYRQLLAFITVESVANKTMSIIAPQYENINGGYTQVYKKGPRRGDGAEMAIIRLTKLAAPQPVEEAPKKKTKKAAKSVAPKAEAPAAEAQAPVAEAPVEEA